MTEQEAIKELNSCHAFGLSSECRSLAKLALEKQIPKKPTDYNEEDGSIDFLCPNCDGTVYRQPYKPNYCKHCGQKIDWT